MNGVFSPTGEPGHPSKNRAAFVRVQTHRLRIKSYRSRGVNDTVWIHHFLYLHSPVQSFFSNHPEGRGLSLA